MGSRQVVRHRVLVPAFAGSIPASPAKNQGGGTDTVPYSEEMRIISGRSSRTLTEAICKHLKTVPGKVHTSNFSDGEIRVQIGENIRGKDVFIVNGTGPPVNRNMMELLILIDAARRASASRVTAVLPYYGYARQDRKDRPRVPITAKLVANLIVSAGADRVLTLDLHCGQIQGFFDIPVDHLDAAVVFTRHLKEGASGEPSVVVSPDTGSVKRAREVANRIDAGLAIVDKRRPDPNLAEVMNVIGDVQGKRAILFDDLVDTAGTLCSAAKALAERGATSVMACCTHAVLSGNAVERIEASPIEELWVSDSIPLSQEAAASGRIRVVTFAPSIGEAIRRIHCEESLSVLFT